MKELSIEEKAKTYDEAVKRAKGVIEQNPLMEYPKKGIEYILPELKESEDEKIRKALIRTFNEKRTNEHINGVLVEDILTWLEKQVGKDKLIRELGEYKVKYMQEVLEKHIDNMNNKDDERLRNTTIAFLKDFADKGYENAIECIDWLEKNRKR